MKFRTQTKRVAQTSTGPAGRVLRAMALGAGLLMSAMAWAGPSVTYVATQGAGISWSYDYTVTGPIDQFGGIDLVFGYASYANLASSSIDPSIVITQPDSVVLLDGDVLATFDSAALGSGSTAMFSVSFDWLGAKGSMPGPQAFSIFDANGGFVLAGRTTPTGSNPSPLPEPSEATLAFVALLALSLTRRRAA